jgi:hypothetical protein
VGYSDSSQVSRSVSADYDRVAGFFEDLRSYLCRLKVLEGNVPPVPELKAVLVQVFTSILVLCAICTKYIRKKRVGMFFWWRACQLFIVTRRATDSRPSQGVPDSHLWRGC